MQDIIHISKQPCGITSLHLCSTSKFDNRRRKYFEPRFSSKIKAVSCALVKMLYQESVRYWCLKWILKTCSCVVHVLYHFSVIACSLHVVPIICIGPLGLHGPWSSVPSEPPSPPPISVDLLGLHLVLEYPALKMQLFCCVGVWLCCP